MSYIDLSLSSGVCDEVSFGSVCLSRCDRQADTTTQPIFGPPEVAAYRHILARFTGTICGFPFGLYAPTGQGKPALTCLDGSKTPLQGTYRQIIMSGPSLHSLPQCVGSTQTNATPHHPFGLWLRDIPEMGERVALFARGKIRRGFYEAVNTLT